MSSTGDILRQKIGRKGQRAGPRARWWQAEADRMFRAVCKAGFGMDVVLTRASGSMDAASTALDGMAAVAVPFVIEGPGGTAGLFVLDGELSDGLIEQQLLSKLLPTKRLERPVTSVDAGLAEEFVRRTLAALGAEAAAQMPGLALKAWEPDRAALRLALGDGAFDILQAEMDMGPGVKSGWCQIWLPAMRAAANGHGKRQVNPDMMAVLNEHEMRLEAWMEGCVATAGQLMALQVGTAFDMPRAALNKVALRDGTGRLFGKGKLGQLQGSRAVRLSMLAHKPAPAAPPTVVMEEPPALQPAAPPLEDAAAPATKDAAPEPVAD